MKSEFIGNIDSVRVLEDCVRATKRYTKYFWTRQRQHKIQGTDFPSRVFTEHYEVYPDTDVHWDMPAGEALDWLWGEVPCVDVRFLYNYRDNKAALIIEDGPRAVDLLCAKIPSFEEHLNPLRGRNGDSKSDNTSA